MKDYVKAFEESLGHDTCSVKERKRLFLQALAQLGNVNDSSGQITLIQKYIEKGSPEEVSDVIGTFIL